MTNKKNTKILLVLIAALIIAAAGCITGKQGTRSTGSESLTLLIQTDKGLVEGAEDWFSTWSWKGIPFAKPPVGELRWKAPQDPDSWTGILKTKEFKSIAPQYDGNFPGEQKVTGNEDCLYLNVWRPQTQEKNLPVFFWIHGGANSVGSASEYKGQNIAGRSNMVVVTTNYRLGPLGWFNLPGLREGENALDGSGNYGTLDMIKALEWVQKNIEAFGGDPDNVMIAGESAGGVNVYTMLVSPLSKGLFSKAMVQSGGFNMVPVNKADQRGEKVLKELLVSDGKSNIEKSEIGNYLRSRSAEEILGMFHPGGFGMLSDHHGVIQDGTVLPENGIDALKNPETYRQVSMIIGANKEEMKLFNYFSFDPASAMDYQQKMEEMSAFMIKRGVDTPISYMLAHDNQPPIYAYQLNYGAYNRNGYNAWPDENTAIQFGACHALDLPLFWAQFPYLDLYKGIFRPENIKGYTALSNAMMRYVSQFAHTGEPGTIDGVNWEAWDKNANGPKRILFDADASEAVIRMSNE